MIRGPNLDLAEELLADAEGFELAHLYLRLGPNARASLLRVANALVMHTCIDHALNQPAEQAGASATKKRAA